MRRIQNAAKIPNAIDPIDAQISIAKSNIPIIASTYLMFIVRITPLEPGELAKDCKRGRS